MMTSPSLTSAERITHIAVIAAPHAATVLACMPLFGGHAREATPLIRPMRNAAEIREVRSA